jgi:hypothetical protein
MRRVSARRIRLRGAGPANMQYRADEPSPSRNRDRDTAGKARRPPARSGWLASVEQARRFAQHHDHATPRQMPRTQPAGERLAVPSRQLAVKPRVQIIRGYPRSLLLRVEQAHRAALAYHVHRDERLGLSVLIKENWYNQHKYLFMNQFFPDRLLVT